MVVFSSPMPSNEKCTSNLHDKGEKNYRNDKNDENDGYFGKEAGEDSVGIMRYRNIYQII